jgi:hypothetical protein
MSYGELCVLLRLPVYSLRCAGGGLTDPLAWPQLAQSLGRTSITSVGSVAGEGWRR